ncbi:maleate cis-trans isomerase family protein [Bradyrhizobium cenepequi]
MNHDVRRIGVLAPPANVAVEREWPRYLPDGVVMNHNRLSRTSTAVAKDELLAMNASVDRAARDLAFAQPEVIVYACTSGSFLDGPDEAEMLARRIEAATGIAAITTSGAVVAALRTLQAKRVYMITPYTDAVNAVEAAFLAHHGLTVAGMDAFRCSQSAEIRALSSEQVAERAIAHHGEISGCDALFISCTNLLTMDKIDGLETTLGVPVVSSNQASLWAALMRLNIAAPDAPGRLFRQMT